MLRKTWLIGIVILFIGASVIPSLSANEADELTTQPQPLDIYWEENFDSYTAGDGMHGVGGWEGWENDPAWDAFVTSDQAQSTPNSVDVVADADLVHPFVGIGGTGLWTFTCFVYVPETFTGMSYFLLLNTYGTGIHNWSTQLLFNSDEGIIYSEFEGEQMFLTFDAWIELRVEIDFDADLQTVYYDGDLLTEKSWTEGLSGGGALALGAVDLFAQGATSIYYDDFTLEGPTPEGPDLDCAGSLSWIDVEPGAIVTGSFTVENVGAPASELNWEIESTPDWGTFTFDPDGGTGLLPGTPVTVDVEVVAPEDPETEFAGEIVLVNSDDPEDTCVIDVALVTPMSHSHPMFEILIRLFPRLANLLGL